MARYTELEKDAIQEIAGSYGLSVMQFEHLEGGISNSSYKLHTRQGCYVLTVFDAKGLSQVTAIGRLLLLLAEHEFPTMRLLNTEAGDIATIYDGKPVMLKGYITGQVHQDLDEGMLRQVGAAMARLHRVPVPSFLPDQQPWGRRHLSRIVGRKVDPAYETWVSKRLAHLEQRIPPGLPRGFIHCDVFYDNVLFEAGLLQAIIDFEEAIHFYKVYDLGMGIVGLCQKGSTIALDKARALINGYQQIRALEEGEKETLKLLVEYAATAASCWRFWKYHFHKPIAEKANVHLQMVRLAKAVRAIPQLRFSQAVLL